MPAPIRWNDELDAKIKHAIENKISAAKLCEEIGISNTAVVLRAERLGFRFQKPDLWTDSEINELKNLWTKGLSGSQIAAVLGKSRNSIIGKAHRLKLEYRGNRPPPGQVPKPKQHKKRIRTKRPVTSMLTKYTKSTPPVFYPASQPVAPRPPISIMELDDSRCREIVGRGNDGLAVYCGDMTFSGKPYCAAHCAMNYQPADHRPRRRA